MNMNDHQYFDKKIDNIDLDRELMKMKLLKLEDRMFEKKYKFFSIFYFLLTAPFILIVTSFMIMTNILSKNINNWEIFVALIMIVLSLIFIIGIVSLVQYKTSAAISRKQNNLIINNICDIKHYINEENNKIKQEFNEALNLLEDKNKE